MNRLTKQIAHNSVNVLFLKISGILATLYASNTLTSEEFGDYSLTISYVIIFGTTFFNFANQTFSIKNTSLISKNSKISYYLIYVLLVTLTTIFSDVLSWEFYISTISIVFASFYNSYLLEKNNHIKMTKINILGIFLFVFLLLISGFLADLAPGHLVFLYSIPYLALFFLGCRNFNLGADKIKINSLKKWGFGFFSAAVIPTTFSILYTYLQAQEQKALLGEFFTVMQWFFVFGQVNQVFGNILIRNTKALLKHQEIALNLLPVLIFAPFIPLITDVHNTLFDKSIGEEQLTTCFIFLTAHNFISAFKSHIGRNIILRNRQELSIISNLLWAILSVSMFFFTPADSLGELSLIIFTSSVLSTIFLFPYFYSERFVFAHDPKSICTTFFCVLVFVLELNIFR